MAPHVESVALPHRVRIPYVEQGDPYGVPVLLLHGFAGSWRDFGLVLPHLPASIRAFALTHRGHGEASKPADGYHLCDFATDVAAFMDALELEATVIVGHSMGSAIAQRFAMDYPEKTSGLVLAGSCVVEPGGPAMRAFWESTVSKLSDPIDPEFVREFLESTFVQPVSQAFFEGALQDALKVPAHVWKGAWKARLELEDASNELKEIKAPTLIVWGDQDTRCPRSDQDILISGIWDSRLLVYPGAGHSPHIEDPERFASDLVVFIKDRID